MTISLFASEDVPNFLLFSVFIRQNHITRLVRGPAVSFGGIHEGINMHRPGRGSRRPARGGAGRTVSDRSGG